MSLSSSRPPNDNLNRPLVRWYFWLEGLVLLLAAPLLLIPDYFPVATAAVLLALGISQAVLAAYVFPHAGDRAVPEARFEEERRLAEFAGIDAAAGDLDRPDASGAHGKARAVIEVVERTTLRGAKDPDSSRLASPGTAASGSPALSAATSAVALVKLVEKNNHSTTARRPAPTALPIRSVSGRARVGHSITGYAASSSSSIAPRIAAMP